MGPVHDPRDVKRVTGANNQLFNFVRLSQAGGRHLHVGVLVTVERDPRKRSSHVCLSGPMFQR
eukprot:4272875-Prymnesium_polylepis.1